MSGSRVFHRIGAAVAKLAFGCAVFATTIAAWSQLRPVMEGHRPLPGIDAPSTPCTLWFVGSSSINRWRGLATDMRPWDARNRGVDGASIREINERFAGDNGGAPAAILFYIGENDIAGGMSALNTARNLARLVGEARARQPGATIFVIGMKPSPARWRFREEQLRFDAITRGAAATGGYRFVDIGAVLLVGGKPGDHYAPDGVHLSAEGYRHWGGAIRAAFERDIPAAKRAACMRARA